MTATANFIGYKTKSDAKRGFGRKFKELADSVEKYLCKEEGKWGFYANGDVPEMNALDAEQDAKDDAELAEMQAFDAAFKPTPEMHTEVMGIVQKAMPEAFKELQDAGIIKSVFPTTTFGGAQQSAKPDAELNAALSQHHEDGSDVQHDAFSAFANAQLTSRPQPTIEPAKALPNNSRIERNREEANGVKRPSAGTLCAQVWDIATLLSNGDEKPKTKIATLSEVVKHAESKGINKFTARTQYARWRVFHGITGRNA